MNKELLDDKRDFISFLYMNNMAISTNKMRSLIKEPIACSGIQFPKQPHSRTLPDITA